MSNNSNSISSNFWSQMSTIVTIVVASIVGFKYGVTQMKEVVSDQVKPLVERIEKIEKKINHHNRLLAVIIEHENDNSKSIENFITYYNNIYHKEFIVPAQITINDLKDINEEE